ncbi:MAG: 3'-5' exoribonuclease [Anaerolineaceae bacterium]
MKHLFIDCETMGTNTYDCAVIDFSAFVLDTDIILSNNPYTLKTIVDVKRFKLNIEKQVAKHGFKVYSDTIKFWQEQPDSVRKRIAPSKDDLTLEDFSHQFLAYLSQYGKIDYWWSRNNAFDPLILWRLFESAGKSKLIYEYLLHWKLRDIRTFIDAKLDFPIKNGFVPVQDEDFWNKVFQEHDSSWDVLADVLRFQAITRAEHDLPGVTR